MCPFLICILYKFFAIMSNFGFMRFINFFSMFRITNVSQLLFPYLPLLGASVILVFAGNLAYKKLLKS